MRSFVFILLLSISTVCTMEPNMLERDPFGYVIVSFKQGDYEEAVGKAIVIAKDGNDAKLAGGCRFFLKEFFLSMCQEAEGLASFESEVKSLTETFNPKSALSNYGDFMMLFHILANEKYEATQKEYWNDRAKETKKFLGKPDDSVRFILPSKPVFDFSGILDSASYIGTDLPPQAEIEAALARWRAFITAENPFLCVVENLKDANYRGCVFQAIHLVKGNYGEEVKTNSKLFLKNFFEYLRENEDSSLGDFKGEVDRLLSGFTPPRDTDGYRELIAMLEDVMTTKYGSVSTPAAPRNTETVRMPVTKNPRAKRKDSISFVED